MMNENQLISDILYDALRDAERELEQVEESYKLFREKTDRRETEFQDSLKPLRERVTILQRRFDEDE